MKSTTPNELWAHSHNRRRHTREEAKRCSLCNRVVDATEFDLCSFCRPVRVFPESLFTSALSTFTNTTSTEIAASLGRRVYAVNYSYHPSTGPGTWNLEMDKTFLDMGLGLVGGKLISVSSYEKQYPLALVTGEETGQYSSTGGREFVTTVNLPMLGGYTVHRSWRWRSVGRSFYGNMLPRIGREMSTSNAKTPRKRKHYYPNNELLPQYFIMLTNVHKALCEHEDLTCRQWVSAAGDTLLELRSVQKEGPDQINRTHSIVFLLGHYMPLMYYVIF